MSMSPSTPEHYVKRAEERQNRLTEGKRAVDEENQKQYAEQQGQHAEVLKKAQKGAEDKVQKQVNALKESRQKRAEELARVQAEISANIKLQQEVHTGKKKEEVEKANRELEKKKEELERKATLLRQQLDESLVILENGERMRQEAVKEMRNDRHDEMKKHNEKMLELNKVLHEKTLETSNKMMEMDNEKHNAEIKQFERTEEKRLTAFSQVQSLTNSLAMQDHFMSFKQKCESLRSRHQKFITEFFDLEATLLRCDQRMSRGKHFDDFEMEELLNALRRFRETAHQFDGAGSSEEQEFGSLIGELIAIITSMTSAFNNIQSNIDDFNEEDNVENKTGIMAEIILIKQNIDTMAPLIQKFNVIPRQHFAETLALQMDDLRASNNGVRAIENRSSHHAAKLAIREE